MLYQPQQETTRSSAHRRRAARGCATVASTSPMADNRDVPRAGSIHVERGRADGAAILRIDRPGARGAIDRAMMEDLESAVSALESDHEVQTVVVAASTQRGTFLAGGDIVDLARLDTPEAGAAMARRMQALLERLSNLDAVVIAAISGDAYGGGCELVLACDLRVMAEDAHLVFSQVRMGLSTGWGGGPRLTRLVGPSRALELLASARPVGAREAASMGLVNRVAPSGLALAHALDLAREIGRHPVAAVRAVKEVVRASSSAATLAQAFERERAVFRSRWMSAEHRRAVQAFMARRAPNLEGARRDSPEPGPRREPR